jgi:RNA recognition motif-containing protein
MSLLSAATDEPDAKRRRVDKNHRIVDDETDTPKASPLVVPVACPEEETKPKKLGSKRIYVGNLHPRVAKVHLEKLLQSYGTVVDIRLCYHTNGHPRGFAFCEFSAPQEADAAIQALHGRSLLSKLLVVQGAHPREAAHSQTQSSGGEMNKQQIHDKIERLKKALLQANR